MRDWIFFGLDLYPRGIRDPEQKMTPSPNNTPVLYSPIININETNIPHLYCLISLTCCCSFAVLYLVIYDYYAFRFVVSPLECFHHDVLSSSIAMVDTATEYEFVPHEHEQHHII